LCFLSSTSQLQTHNLQVPLLGPQAPGLISPPLENTPGSASRRTPPVLVLPLPGQLNHRRTVKRESRRRRDRQTGNREGWRGRDRQTVNRESRRRDRQTVNRESRRRDRQTVNRESRRRDRQTVNREGRRRDRQTVNRESSRRRRSSKANHHQERTSQALKSTLMVIQH
jgi:hypothetical protein